MDLDAGEIEGMTRKSMSRRGFFTLLPGVLLAVSTREAWARTFGAPGGPKHPTPRRGIDASNVMAAKDVHGEKARETFDLVRQIPQVVDGIRCHCGCAEMEGFYSLLTCFEKDGMAQHCDVCQGLARLAHRMHRAGKSLDQIRVAADAYPG